MTQRRRTFPAIDHSEGENTINTLNAAGIALPGAEDPHIDMTFITTFTGMTDKWFYKQIQDGDFPKPIKLGRRSRWFKSEVETWMRERITASRT